MVFKGRGSRRVMVAVGLIATCVSLPGHLAFAGADETAPQIAAVEPGAGEIPASPNVANPTVEMLPPGETPTPIASEPPAAPASPVVAAPSAVVPATDPIILAVRDLISKPIAGVDKADMAALVAFYASRATGPVWIKDGAYNAPAQSVIKTLKEADNWGLEAKAFPVATLEGASDPTSAAKAEVSLATALLRYAHFASGGRVDPSTLSRVNDMRGTFADPVQVLAAVATTQTPGTYLTGLHPAHPQFHKLREALLVALHGAPAKEELQTPDAPKLALKESASVKPGGRHPDVPLIRAFLNVPPVASGPEVYDPALVAAVKAFQESHGLKANGFISNATRAAFSGTPAKAKLAAADPRREVERIALNMERWRWMPVDMGAFHILDNIPEYTTRAVKDGQIIYTEKIIVGKPDTPTSVFSANMQFVIFHPEWGVPDGIKIKEIWPSLRRKTTAESDFFGIGPSVSDTRILQRHNLRVSYNGRPVDASQVDWTKADPRAYQFIQPAGGTNVLGVVKFRFPNRHDIYMHDTPQRELFASTARAFSHGCMRVNNPRRLAEVILGEDKGWTPEKVGAALAGSGAQEVKLDRPFPVHVAYFTARVDDEGKLHTFSDIYGHDAKLASALAGRPVRLEEPSVAASEDVLTHVPGGKRTAYKKGAPPPKQANLGTLLEGLFGN